MYLGKSYRFFAEIRRANRAQTRAGRIGAVRHIGAVGHIGALDTVGRGRRSPGRLSAQKLPEFLALFWRNAVFKCHARTDLIATHLFDNVICLGNLVDQ